VNILMVCLGNICRSPMAEGLMHAKIVSNGLKAAVDSAGFESFHINDTPDHRAIKVMGSHGIDISKHRMRLFKELDFDIFDRIYVMDRYNYQDVISLARNETDIAKVDYILNTIEPGSNHMVPDPYYGGVTGFEKVYDMLDKATDSIVNEIKNRR
jgi:protein-tyrosine phosphatase